MARRCFELSGRPVGDGKPVYFVAEIGINHNGDIDIAKRLVDVAVECGCDAVKLQKRTPELSVPPSMRDVMRETPWGYISYMEYRERVEFGLEQYDELDRYCKGRGIHWFASCWDGPSIDFIEGYKPVCFKVPSACLTDRELLERLKATGRPIMLSTGMSTMDEIRAAADVVGEDQLLIAHSTSTYPCHPSELNLRMISTLREQFDCPIGYSGHEAGLATTVAAVAMGASFVERHVTLDRTMWGSDQAASVEPVGLRRLLKDIRVVEAALGDGLKKVYESEQKAASRLRVRNTLNAPGVETQK